MDKVIWEALLGDAFREKRKDRRVFAGDDFVVEFRVKGKEGTFTKGHASDLSAGGVAFATMVPLQKGESIELVLNFAPQFPGPQQVKVIAEVMRLDFGSSKFVRHVACAFKQTTFGIRQTIRNFIIWLLVRNLQDFVEDHVWKISAQNQYFVDFQHAGKECRGFGCELSVAGIRFTTTLPLHRGSTLLVKIHFSPYFPGPTSLEVPALVLQVRKAENGASYDVRCRLELHRIEARQTLEAFLKWLVSEAD